MNLDKLTPAPWYEGKPYAEMCDCFTGTLGGVCSNVWADGGHDVTKLCAGLGEDDAKFMALARNAFDVMMRRGWTLYRDGGGYWIAVVEYGGSPIIRADDGELCWYTGLRPDPFTALVEADKWYREHIDKNTGSDMHSRARHPRKESH